MVTGTMLSSAGVAVFDTTGNGSQQTVFTTVFLPGPLRVSAQATLSTFWSSGAVAEQPSTAAPINWASAQIVRYVTAGWQSVWIQGATISNAQDVWLVQFALTAKAGPGQLKGPAGSETQAEAVYTIFVQS